MLDTASKQAADVADQAIDDLGRKRRQRIWDEDPVPTHLRVICTLESRGTVRRVLEAEGVLSDPDRHVPVIGTCIRRGGRFWWLTWIAGWHRFLLQDCVDAEGQAGIPLMFIHLSSRCAAGWVQQQARNVTMWTKDEGLETRLLLRERDSKYTEASDEHFRHCSGAC